jgi:hypothetical protein
MMMDSMLLVSMLCGMPLKGWANAMSLRQIGVTHVVDMPLRYTDQSAMQGRVNGGLQLMEPPQIVSVWGFMD